jgi:anaerobic dimethyl sulfoxide reductase subunit B (iron-sulfur subunit)
MTQHGFFFDQSRCIGCSACVVACEQWHQIGPGPVKWTRVFQWEKGSYPDIKLHILAIPCYHCMTPVCVKSCPNKALYKEEKYGAVLVDRDKCRGTRKCWRACPYGVPQYGSDATGEKMSKCTMCFDRLEQGLKPICVLSCSMRALEFGPIDELRAKYGTLAHLADMPREAITKPAVVFKPADAKKQIIPWDADAALLLWQKRQPSQGKCLPDIFMEKTVITLPPRSIIGRHKLALKTKHVAEQLYYTSDDE